MTSTPTSTPTFTCTPSSPDCGGGEEACLDVGRCACFCVSPTPTNPLTPTSPPTATATGNFNFCGDRLRAADENCDDGNNFGGDGCAANCTIESDAVIALGDASNSQSGARIQAVAFGLDMQLTGRVILTHGRSRAEQSFGVDGSTNFDPGEIPIVQVIEKNRGLINAIIVPTIACACLRGLELRTCNGYPPLPGVGICTAETDPCSLGPPGPSCATPFGPGNSAAGKFGCGIRDVDYLLTVDRDTQETFFSTSGGPAYSGAFVYSYDSLGLIPDGGLCNQDLNDPRKGPDGIPCTDDDPPESRGVPAARVQTTGTAKAEILRANGTASNIDETSSCGLSPCLTSATGNTIDCFEFLSDRMTGFCLASAAGGLAQPQLGDVVTTVRLCALDPGLPDAATVAR